MACVDITLANRAATLKWKNLRRLWSKTSSVMPHLQILGRGRDIDADHSRQRRRPQGICNHQFGVSGPAKELREWVFGARRAGASSARANGTKAPARGGPFACDVIRL